MLVLPDSMRGFTGLMAVTLSFLAAGGILVASNRTVGRDARRVFLSAIVALAFITFADWFTYVFSTQLPHLRLAHIVAMAATFAVAPVIPVAIANTIFPQPHVKWMAIPLGAQALLEVATVFGGYVFWVDEANVYHRGSFYLAYMLVYTLSAVYLVIESIRAGRTYQSANLATIVSILVCMMVGVGIQVADSTIRTTWPAVSMAVVLYFEFYAEMILRTDALTKLLNRHSYDEFLETPPLPCTVVLIDVDNFKHANDTYGHAFGDVCLTTIASLIRKAYGSHGLCYRTGGDEFTVVLTKQSKSAEELSDRLAQLVRKAQKSDERIPSVSVGFARADVGCPHIESVVAKADEHMYASKRAKKTVLV